MWSQLGRRWHLHQCLQNNAPRVQDSCEPYLSPAGKRPGKAQMFTLHSVEHGNMFVPSWRGGTKCFLFSIQAFKKRKQSLPPEAVFIFGKLKIDGLHECVSFLQIWAGCCIFYQHQRTLTRLNSAMWKFF